MSPVVAKGGVLDGIEIEPGPNGFIAPVWFRCQAAGYDSYDQEGNLVERSGCRFPGCENETWDETWFDRFGRTDWKDYWEAHPS